MQVGVGLRLMVVVIMLVMVILMITANICAFFWWHCCKVIATLLESAIHSDLYSDAARPGHPAKMTCSVECACVLRHKEKKEERK